MTKPKRRTYDEDFKRQTVALADASESTDAAIEKDLGLYNGAIRHWREDIAHHKEEAFPGKGHLRPTDDEFRRLKRELELVRQERDILKKAVAIFSAPPRTDSHS
jgi:transposase